jgi:hypothetical protein
MKTIKLYKVTAEFVYNDEIKQARQAALLSELGLKESEKGYVVCRADDALALISAGYCGDYLSHSQVPLITTLEVGDDVEGMFRVMAEKLASVTHGGFNERCGQRQPGESLMAVSETMLVQDGCTDVLQRHLSDGWRIVAVQPQPDQRRPDYILGRSRRAKEASPDVAGW